MTRLCHAPRAVAGDVWRGLSGTALCLAPLVAAPLPAGVAAVLVVLALLFAGLALRAATRLRQVVETDAEGIAVAGRRVRWDRLKRVSLAYYSTRRDRETGWMRLSLTDSDGGRLHLESTLEGFTDLALRAGRAADSLDLDLSPATRGNLDALRESRP